MLLIDSPLNGNIDIHGFGKGDKNVSPLIHGVIDHNLARYLYKVRYKPSYESKQFITSHVQSINYNNFLGHSEIINIMIIKYQMLDCPFDSLYHCNVQFSHLNKASICPTIGNNIDVSIIISKKTNETSYQLVRLRYHKTNIVVSSQLSKNLLSDLKNIMAHGGYECMRNGGSSGRT